MLFDEIKNPEHYQLPSGFETKYVIKLMLTDEEYRGWLKGSAFKYLMRYEKKGTPLKDLQKARQFIDFLIAEYNEEETPVDDE